MRRPDAVVVGCGVMGAAAARSLASRGWDVVVLERFQIGHGRGSSHGDARIFRLSYPDRVFVAMAQEALVLWRRLEEEAGEPLLRTTGGLDLPPFDANEAALRARGAPHEVVAGSEAMERFPVLAVPPGERLLFQPDAGVVSADRAWRAFVGSAAGRGAEVRQTAPAEHLRLVDGAVEVIANDETYRASIAVVTAGAWSRGLLAGVGIDLPVRVTRETPVYFRLEGGPSPVLLEAPAYALPSPSAGLKAAEDGVGDETNPDETGRPNGASVERVRRWVERRFKAVEALPAKVETCLYTSTPDERFVLQRRGPIVVGSACSGHGFKFAPLIGERLADLAAG